MPYPRLLSQNKVQERPPAVVGLAPARGISRPDGVARWIIWNLEVVLEATCRLTVRWQLRAPWISDTSIFRHVIMLPQGAGSADEKEVAVHRAGERVSSTALSA